MTPASYCAQCANLDVCCSLAACVLEVRPDHPSPAAPSRVRRVLLSTITGAAILTGPSLSAVALWLDGAFS